MSLYHIINNDQSDIMTWSSTIVETLANNNSINKDQSDIVECWLVLPQSVAYESSWPLQPLP